VPSLEILVPLTMSLALVWWIGRGLSWTTRLTVIAVTLALVAVVVGLERAGYQR
jgi:hypothetical protein